MFDQSPNNKFKVYLMHLICSTIMQKFKMEGEIWLNSQFLTKRSFVILNKKITNVMKEFNLFERAVMLQHYLNLIFFLALKKKKKLQETVKKALITEGHCFSGKHFLRNLVENLLTTNKYEW